MEKSIEEYLKEAFVKIRDLEEENVLLQKAIDSLREDIDGLLEN